MLSALKHIKTIFPAGAGWVCFGWLFVLSGTLGAQHVFNQYFDWDSSVQIGAGLVETGQHYMFLVNNTGRPEHRLLRLLKLGQDGCQMSEALIVNDSFQNHIPAWGGFEEDQETGEYVLYGALEDLRDGGKIKGFIYRIDSDGVILRSHISNSDYGFFDYQDLLFEGDQYIILSGDTSGASTNTRLMWLDRDLNFLSERTYPHLSYQTPRKMARLPDGSVVIVGSNRRGWVDDMFVMYIGADYKERWYRVYGGDNFWGTEVPGVAVLENGDILAVTGLAKIGQSHYSKYAIRLRPDGTTVWERQYRQERNCAFMTNPVVKGKNEIYIPGYRDILEEGATSTSRYATISRLDENGDIAWERMYYTHECRGSNILALYESLDGGFIGVGDVSPRNTLGLTQDAWIVKTDADGCLVAGCDSIGMISSTDLAEVPLGRLLAGPNPVGEILYVQYDLYEPDGGYEISLLDSRGMELKRLSLAGYAPAGQIDWTMNGLPAGLYVLKLSYNGVPQAIVKLVKT